MERREHPRFRLRRKVSVILRGFARLEAWTVDVGHGGIRLVVPRSLATAQVIGIELDGPAEGGLANKATVCHVQPHGLGAEIGVRWLDRRAA